MTLIKVVPLRGLEVETRVLDLERLAEVGEAYAVLSA